ncbi:hypothetical protein PG997_007901 [Apiospora hydei]|uniref:Uncharacterized protein n=1 Tax=Apiospora hydei TaxID=1337664 RepID=A0ABR1W9B7_9PEZI
MLLDQQGNNKYNVLTQHAGTGSPGGVHQLSDRAVAPSPVPARPRRDQVQVIDAADPPGARRPAALGRRGVRLDPHRDDGAQLAPRALLLARGAAAGPLPRRWHRSSARAREPGPLRIFNLRVGLCEAFKQVFQAWVPHVRPSLTEADAVVVDNSLKDLILNISVCCQEIKAYVIRVKQLGDTGLTGRSRPCMLHEQQQQQQQHDPEQPFSLLGRNAGRGRSRAGEAAAAAIDEGTEGAELYRPSPTRPGGSALSAA